MSAASSRGAPGQRPEPDPNKVPFAERRSALVRKTPLRKSRKTRRPMKPEAMLDLIQRVMLRDGRCVAIDHDTAMCDGPTDAAHVIPQRVLRAHYPEGDPVFEDVRNARALCRLHHTMLDSGHLAACLPNPLGFEDFCAEHGFDSNGRYWYAA